MKFLLPIAWTVWGASFLALLYSLYSVTGSRGGSTESLREISAFIVSAILLADVIAGIVLAWASYRQATSVISAITTIIALPVVFTASVAVIGLAVSAVKEKIYTDNATKEGDFHDHKLQLLAAAINEPDPDFLRKALAGQPVPKGKDRAGLDLLNYAIRRYRFSNGSLECVQILLAAGADPNTPEPQTHWPPLAYLGPDPAAVRLFVESGANIEALADGLTPVVRYTMMRNWESAIYLVQKGARLDVQARNGVSMDHFLREWKDSVNGDQHEGWDRLRAAISTARRANPSASVPPDAPVIAASPAVQPH